VSAGTGAVAGTAALLDAVRAGVRAYDLAQPLENGMPCSPNHPGFKLALQRRHGDMVRPDGGSAANEMIVTGGHVGTHVDALCHVSQDGQLHGGANADDVQRGGRFSVHGVETIPPMLVPGILLDVAAAHGETVLPAGYGISADDLAAAADRAGVLPTEGGACLVRTGWARRWSDPATYLGQDTGVPGLTESAAQWLVDRGVAVAGADTTAFEQIAPGQGHRTMPVHRLLLVESGVYIVEHLMLEEVGAAGLDRFLFVLTPLKIVGGTGSPVRPLAVVGADHIPN
jgi:kynurenine formamidase